MNRDRLEEAERLAMEIAAPLPAIMTLVAADEQLNQPAIMTLLETVNSKAAEISDSLFRLRRDMEPPASEPAV